jgi:hypothetical protein
LTRHHDGFVRQKHLERIIRSENIWMPPFVIRLVGEYIVEILDATDQNLSNLDISIYEQFAWWNPELIALTEQRVISYWNEYYRPRDGRRISYERNDYVGFWLIRFFKSLARNGRPN